jgi:hypothetical protein
VYILPSFEAFGSSVSCKTLALLGIYFPVASFFWTDFIAWHIYTTISSRKVVSDEDWDRTMKRFHIIAWGISLLCISLVAGFDHAGREDNTGGWCWVTANSNLIVWEIIGGKAVEWTSCFIWLPAMYILTVQTLREIFRDGRMPTQSNPTSITGRLTSTPDRTSPRDSKFIRFYTKMVVCSVVEFITCLIFYI